MKERVSAYGGDLRVGPRSNGGYGVRAQIPFHPADPLRSRRARHVPRRTAAEVGGMSR